MEFLMKDGVYKNRFREFETEISLNDTLLMIQFSVLSKGLFVPCYDLSQFDCKYKCKKNRRNRCPYSQRMEKIVRSEITYFQCRDGIKNEVEKMKKWLYSVCGDEGYAEIISGEWLFNSEEKQFSV